MPVRIACGHAGERNRPGPRKRRFRENRARNVERGVQSNRHCGASAQYTAVRPDRKECVDRYPFANSLLPALRPASSTGRSVAIGCCALRYRGNGAPLTGGSDLAHGRQYDKSADASLVDDQPLRQGTCRTEAFSRNGGPGHVAASASNSIRFDRRIGRVGPNDAVACFATAMDGTSAPVRRRMAEDLEGTAGTIRASPTASSANLLPCGSTWKMAASTSNAGTFGPHVRCQERGRMYPRARGVRATDLSDAVFLVRIGRIYSDTGFTEIEHLSIHDATPLWRRLASRCGRSHGHARGYGESSIRTAGNRIWLALPSVTDPATGNRCPVR